MSAFSLFNQFDRLVRERSLTTPEETIKNLAARTDYALSAFINNRPLGQVLRTGKYLTERVKLSVGGNFSKFVPGGVHTSTRTTTVQSISWPVAFYRNSYPTTEAELLASEGTDQAAMFKSYKASIDQEITVAHWEGLEDLLFARPASATMETLTAQNCDCMSIPCYITENDSGTASELYKPPVTVWTASTIAQLSPVTYSNWRNYKGTFNSGDPSHPTLGLFSAFGKATKKIRFTKPVGAKVGQHYMESGLEKLMIWTNTDGSNLAGDLLRAGQDQFRGNGSGSDPAYEEPMYFGKKIRIASSLDTNLLDESAGAYTGTAYPSGKPRFFLVNANHLFLAFHKDKMMQRYSKDGAANQPDTTVQFMESYVQLICNARNRQAIVYPA